MQRIFVILADMCGYGDAMIAADRGHCDEEGKYAEIRLDIVRHINKMPKWYYVKTLNKLY